MPTILLTWELGSGIGHLMNLRPIGQALVQRGHRVIAAVRDISGAREIFSRTGISYLPAPAMPPEAQRPFNPTRGFAHLLGNIGFGDDTTLDCLFTAWNTLNPAVMIFLAHSAFRFSPLPFLKAKPAC